MSVRNQLLASFVFVPALALATLGAACSNAEPCGAACGADDDDTITTQTTTDPDLEVGVSAVRVIHGSPDAPAVDVWIKGGAEPIISDLAFGETSDYLEVPSADYEIELRASPSAATDPVAYSGWLELQSQHRVTTVAAGLLGSSASGDKFRVLKYDEGFGPAGSGSAIVRVIHAGADAPTVGLDLHDDDASAPEISGLDRFTASDADGFALNSDEAIQIGITSNGQRVTAFTTPALPEGAKLFVVATGLVGQPAREADGFSLLAVGPEGTVGFIKQNPVVYALHGSPNAPAVDGFVGESELFSLSFGELSKPIQVPPGAYDIDFYPASAGTQRPAGAPAVSANTSSLAAGEQYLTIATGILGGSPNAFQLQSYAEGFDRSDDTASRVRLVHSSPDAPAVDIGILNAELVVSPLLVSNVSFPQASGADGINTGVGQIPIGVTPAGANSTVVASFHVQTAAGLRAFGIAAGALSSQNGQSFRLLVVDTAASPWTVGTIHPQP